MACVQQAQRRPGPAVQRRRLAVPDASAHAPAHDLVSQGLVHRQQQQQAFKHGFFFFFFFLFLCMPPMEAWKRIQLRKDLSRGRLRARAAQQAMDGSSPRSPLRVSQARPALALLPRR